MKQLERGTGLVCVSGMETWLSTNSFDAVLVCRSGLCPPRNLKIVAYLGAFSPNNFWHKTVQKEAKWSPVQFQFRKWLPYLLVRDSVCARRFILADTIRHNCDKIEVNVTDESAEISALLPVFFPCFSCISLSFLTSGLWFVLSLSVAWFAPFC